MKPLPSWTDAEIDAVLRAVSVPPAVVQRIEPGRLFGDGVIDRLLVELPLPPDIARRIACPAAGTAHEAARSARMPAVSRPTAPPWWRGIVRDAIAVGLSLGLITALFLAGVRLAEPTRTALPRRHTPQARASARDAGPSVAETPRGRVPDSALGHAEAGRPSVERPAAPGTDAAPVPTPRRPRSVRAAPLPAVGAMQRGSGGNRHGLLTGVQVIPEGNGSDGSTRRLVPAERGFDLAFEMAHGEQPFIDPSVVPTLAVDRPPLVVATESFDRVWPLPQGRERLAGLESLRTEHLLAALSSAPDDGRLDVGPRLELRAVKSLRPGRATYLVELTVSAPPPARGPGPQPADVAVVLDHSTGPDALPLWIAACRGLAAAAAAMGPADRLTVIVAEPRPRVVAIRAATAEIAVLAAELEAEPPFGTADLDAAVGLAEGTAAREGMSPRLVVVAQADQAERCLGRGRAMLLAWRATAARGESAEGAPTFVLVSGVAEGDSAAEGVTPGWTLSDPVVVRRRVAASLHGGWPVAVRDAWLEVRFDPREVAAFRLVGHRQTVPESLAASGAAGAAGLPIDLYPGETARVVYEVVPRAGVSGTLAGISARLVHAHATGSERQVSSAGARLDGAGGDLPSARDCELLLAVGLGELAGRSVHAVPGRVATQRLREMAAAWSDRGDMTAVGARLLALFEDAAGSRGGAGR